MGTVHERQLLRFAVQAMDSASRAILVEFEPLGVLALVL
jgi:hypothetical protein